MSVQNLVRLGQVNLVDYSVIIRHHQIMAFLAWILKKQFVKILINLLNKLAFQDILSLLILVSHEQFWLVQFDPQRMRPYGQWKVKFYNVRLKAD